MTVNFTAIMNITFLSINYLFSYISLEQELAAQPPKIEPRVAQIQFGA